MTEVSASRKSYVERTLQNHRLALRMKCRMVVGNSEVFEDCRCEMRESKVDLRVMFQQRATLVPATDRKKRSQNKIRGFRKQELLCPRSNSLACRNLLRIDHVLHDVTSVAKARRSLLRSGK